MHCGRDPFRKRSVLTFFTQDSDTHNLVYTDADVAKTTQVLSDRSFDHDNDTEREDGIHRMDAHIVADEETVKAADDPHMLDFRP